MIIGHQTLYSFAVLLLNSFLFGIAFSVGYTVFVSFPSLFASCHKICEGYKAFLRNVRMHKSCVTTRSICDFLTCVCLSTIVCFLLFVFNSGQFRPSVLIVFILGFLLGKSLLQRLLQASISLLAYVLMRIVYTAYAPIYRILKWTTSWISRLVSTIIRKQRLSMMKKYTKNQIEQLEHAAEFGFIDEYYKELLK